MSLNYNTKDEIFEEIKKIVIEQHGPFNFELTRETRISDDLELAGLDVEEIMVPFFEKFQVHEGDFDFLRYFLPESIDMLGIEFIKSKFTGKEYPPNVKDVTLGDLENAAIAKVWKDSSIPYREPRESTFVEKYVLSPIFGFLVPIACWISILMIIIAGFGWVYFLLSSSV